MTKESKYIAIAIDGPAGSGKSTVASEVAKRLGICHLDSGAMYRATAYAALSQGLPIGESNQPLQEFVEKMKMEISIEDDGSQSIYIDDENVTPYLREPAATMGSAQVAQLPFVREKLVELQRFFATNHHVVMDGRDIGTQVLPDTPYKYYLTADVMERAQRRHAQKPDRPLQEIEKDIEKRDYEDETRAVSPLRKAQDALLIDSTNLTQEQTIQEILKRVPHDVF